MEWRSIMPRNCVWHWFGGAQWLRHHSAAVTVAPGTELEKKNRHCVVSVRLILNTFKMIPGDFWNLLGEILRNVLYFIATNKINTMMLMMIVMTLIWPGKCGFSCSFFYMQSWIPTGSGLLKLLFLAQGQLFTYFYPWALERTLNVWLWWWWWPDQRAEGEESFQVGKQIACSPLEVCMLRGELFPLHS